MKKVISTDKAPGAVGPYSQAIRAGDFLFISGQIGIVPATGKMVEGGVEEQAEMVLLNMKAILEEAGLDLGSVVKCTVFLKNMDDFSKMNTEYTKWFSDPPPARAAVEVARLPKDVDIEIEAISLL